MTATHTVPSDVFDALARGEGDAGGVLREGQRSKRLLLLHQLITTARSRAPQLVAEARADESYALLVDAQRRSRHQVDDLLLYPHVGSWATRSLRRLVATGSIGPEDLGHLGAVAASAGLRTGQAFDVTAYVSDRSLMLPSLGAVRLDMEDGWCHVRSQPGAQGVEIAGAAAQVAVSFDARLGSHPTWLPLRRLRSSSGDLALDVGIDDLDPYRGCEGLPLLDRLETAAVDDWQTKLDEAWPLLVEHHRPQAAAIATGITCLVPLGSTDAAPERSATCHGSVGGVAMTLPQTSLALALALVHEMQHTKLCALLDLVPLVDQSTPQLFYAPWRADPRPLRGLLQGTYAYLALTGFWEVHRRRDGIRSSEADVAQFEFALGREQVRRAVDTLRRSEQLTSSGTRFVAGMDRTLSAFEQLRVPSRPRSLAQFTSLDHAISWRLRNLRPDADQVAQWVRDWLDGKPFTWRDGDRATVAAGDALLPSDTRRGLLRRRLAFPGRWRDDSDDASSADIELVAGKWTSSLDRFRTQISQNPDDLASWSGLALVRHHHPPSPATWALTTYPEVVYAVHSEVCRRDAAPEIEELAGWIGDGLESR